MPSFARELETTLHNALAAASSRKHEYATLEHLLYALVDDEHASKVMTACGVELGELKETVAHYLDTELESLKVEGDTDPSPTSGFQRVVQRAILHVQSSGRDDVTGANVLVALFSERESYAVYFLQQQDMSRLDAVSYISHGVGKGAEVPEPREVKGIEDKEEKKQEAQGKGKQESALKQFCVDLNEKAKNGKVDPLIGRGPEVDRTVQILCRRSKNNPLYVGEPGVGKTAIAEGLARKIIEGDVPEVLLPAIIYSLDMGALLAGTLLPIVIPGLVLSAFAALREARPMLRAARLALVLSASLLLAFTLNYGVPDPAMYCVPVLMVALLWMPSVPPLLTSRLPRLLIAMTAIAAIVSTAAWGLSATLAHRAQLERIDTRIRAAWNAIPFDRGVVLWKDDHCARLVLFQLLEHSHSERVVANPTRLTWRTERLAFERHTGFDALAGLDLHTKADLALIPPNVRRLSPLPVVEFKDVLGVERRTP